MAIFTDPLAIGKITTSEQPFTVQRGNETINISEGDFIYLDDVINAGGTSVGIAFADETTMSVDPNSTMVIDDFVYDPENPTVGSMNANVLEGNFSFVSGQIAKTGADAMKVTTPVLTIGVRGTQVAGKANTEGEDNEIVLLPNSDGSVGQVMIKNQSGEVLLTQPYEATTITDAYTVPTVPVILQKAVVLEKFASTIATTRQTEAKAEVERETKEAAKEKAEAEAEAEELEEEKEQLEEEKEVLEEEAEELEEKSEELEEEAEELEGEAEELEEAEEKVLEEKQQAEEKAEEVAEEIEELAEQLDDAPVQEREKIEQELQALEEEFEDIEEEVQQIEQEIEVVAEKKAFVERQVQEIEKEFAEIQEDFAEIEAKVEFVEQEVQQVIEQEIIVERRVLEVEQRFEAIIQEFEVFQKEFVQEFENFIPADEIQQFMEEAPQDIIRDVQENVMEEFNEIKEDIEKPEDIMQEEPEDIFADENMEQQMQELENNEEFKQLEEMMENEMPEEFKNFEEDPKFVEDNDIFNQPEDMGQIDDMMDNLMQDDQFQPDMNDDMMDMEQDMKQMEEQFQADQEEFKQLEEQFKAEEQAFQQQMEQDQARWEAEQKAYEEQYKEEQFFNDLYVVDQRDFDDQQWYDMEDPFGVADVDVIQINQAPVISNTSAVSLAENVSTGTAVSTISASDAESETITYSITAGNTGNAFTINSSTGAITTAAALDYETTTSYTLTITATDSFGNATTTTQTVNVTDVNEVSNDPSAWVTAGDGSAGAYKQKIGYVGTGDGAGIITELGHTAEAYNANNLDTYDVIAYYNTSNGQFYNGPFSTALTSWVDDGGVLVVYDRWVDDAGLDTNLPGHNGNVVTTRGVNSDTANRTYNIVDESTSNLLKYGPGGIHIDGNSGYTHAGNNWLGEFHIGGGSYTNHGYMSNLDSDVLGLATRDNSNEYIDAVWSYGSGAVYYSTTPTDHYIGTNFAENDAWDAYALNSLHYATSLIFDGYSQIDGTGSADKLYGTADDDVFWSKDGADEIWSGNGSDTFTYTQTYQTDPGSSDTILDFDKSYDAIDISAITNGAGIETRLTNGTLFEIDSNKDGSYEMQWTLDGYTGTADEVTVIT